MGQAPAQFDLSTALATACFSVFLGVGLILAGLYAPASVLEMLPRMGWVAKDNVTTARAYLIGIGVTLVLVALIVPFAVITT